MTKNLQKETFSRLHNELSDWSKQQCLDGVNIVDIATVMAQFSARIACAAGIPKEIFIPTVVDLINGTYKVEGSRDENNSS